MEVVSDYLFRRLEYETRLHRLAISGPEHLKYLMEHPNERMEHMRNLSELRDEIAKNQLRDNDREFLLGEARMNLKMLDGNSSVGESMTGSLTEKAERILAKYEKDESSEAGSDEAKSASSIGIKDLLNYLKPTGRDLVAGGVGFAAGWKGKEFVDKKLEELGRKQAEYMLEAMEKAGYLQKNSSLPQDLQSELIAEIKKYRESAQSLAEALKKLYEKL